MHYMQPRRRYDAPVPNRPSTFPRTISLSIKRAQELAGGNLSAAISTALKRYVEVEDARSAGFDEVIVKVGFGAGRKVRFPVSCWASGTAPRASGSSISGSAVGRRRFALHIERTEYFEMRDAEGNPLTGWRAWTGIGMASGGGRPADATLDVYDTLEELREHVPEEFWEVVAASVKHPYVEDLDI